MKKKQRMSVYGNIDWEKARSIFQKSSLPKHASGNVSTKDIIRMAAYVGTVGLIFICPPAGAVIGKLLLDGQEYEGWETRRILSRLSKQKDVTVEERKDGILTVTITKQGMKKALTYQLDTMRLITPKKWDKKWRVIIFDIPDWSRHTRDVFRKRLEQLGLRMLQKSVWVSPYPCFNEVEFLRELYGIAVTVQYLLVEKIEEDDVLKRQFDLFS